MLWPNKNFFRCSHCSSAIFNFIIFVHISLGNFHFNWCLIFTKCCFLALKKFQMVKCCSDSSHSVKIFPNQQNFPFSPTGGKIPPPLNTIWKILKHAWNYKISTLQEKKELLKKLTASFWGSFLGTPTSQGYEDGCRWRPTFSINLKYMIYSLTLSWYMNEFLWKREIQIQ